MRKVDEVYGTLVQLEKTNKDGVSAMDVVASTNLGRSNISRYLNLLHREGKLIKLDGRPVLYKSIGKDKENHLQDNKVTFSKKGLDKMTGASQSLSISIEKAKAAIIYPPKGLHTILLGETGVGKSLFAEQMYEYAKETNILEREAPFIRFNCADYVDNPSLLIAQIFGVKKGAFTGADKDKDGLLKQADKGILFLDEVHRLPPQGQEMLFTYIDKGMFRPLGETEQMNYVNVRIIAATTEDTDSYLLKTFTRRIPMTIVLPNLKERSLSERYSLIESFIKEESHRIGKSIYINKNCIISYLLYDCPNNIGQLKSDIQLACAKAFLKHKASSNSYILIEQSDLPNHVRKGMLYINEHRKEVNELMQSTYDVLGFSEKDEPQLQLTHEEENIGEDFYNIIDEKIEALKELGIEENEISEILNVDIESHFQKYIGAISQRFGRDELNNLVDIEIIQVVEEILALAEETFNKSYDEKIYFGLTFHLERSVDRIRNGEKIYNPKLNFIRVNYEKEFIFAMRIAKIIDRKFLIETPVDEIGYLSMFFTTDAFGSIEEQPKVRVMVMMHGRSTASSMVEVVNSLVGSEDVLAIDMPITMKPQIMYEITKEKVIEIHNGKGIIMLVDMGSLTNFGDMIKEETGIEIRTIDMVSTLTVLDIARKATMNYSLDEIVSSVIKSNQYNPDEHKPDSNSEIIITACFTGEGSSVKIGNIVKKLINNKELTVMPMNIVDENSFEDRIMNLKLNYNILAIISTIDIKIGGIPFIPAIDIFNNKGKEKLTNILEEAEMYSNVGNSLKEHLLNIKGEEIVKDVKGLLFDLEETLQLNIPRDVKMGITLHICFLFDNISGGGKSREFEGLEEFLKRYSVQIWKVKALIKKLEDKYNIKVKGNEMAYIVKLLIENNISVK